MAMFSLIPLGDDVRNMRINFDGVKPWAAGVPRSDGKDSLGEIWIASNYMFWTNTSYGS